MNQDSDIAKPVRLRDRLREEANRAILTAAEEVFSEEGLGARMEQIAARAGVAVGTLYNHFQDRGALVNALACSTKGVVLLEKFFEGKKIGVVGFKSGSHSANLIMVDHEHFNIPSLFIVKQVLTPSQLAKWKPHCWS